MDRQAAFKRIMESILDCPIGTDWRTAMIIAAGDMVELSGGGHPDSMLHLLEPELCKKLRKLAKSAGVAW